MDLRERIGIDFGRRLRLEEALKWAMANQFYNIDIRVDKELKLFTENQIRWIRTNCERENIHVALHTSSAVNVAELSPFLSEAVDRYLHSYVDLAKRLNCKWIVVHAGYHFTSDFEARRSAALEHLKRALEYGEESGISLLLENMNREPIDAEVHYLGHSIEECRYYFEAISSKNFGWAFTVNHAHMVPEGINGFLDAFGLDRCEEVRLADSRGDKEEHLKFGEGSIDFKALFERLETAGYRGCYVLAFGSLEDMRDGRDYLLTRLGIR